MISNELRQNIQNIFTERYTVFEEDFIKDYELDGEKRYNIEEKDNNITYLGIENKIKYYSTILRSYDSSIGNLYEKIMSDLSEYGGFISIPSIVSCELSNIEENIIKNFDTKSKIRDFNFTTLDCPSSNDKSITFDLLLKKEVNGIQIYNIFEIKTGGDLDNKKAKSEKRALFEKCIYLYKYLKKNNISNFEIKAYFATIYNKNLLDGTTNNWVQERVREHFHDEELLIGKDFFNFVCNQDNGELWEIIKSNVKNVNQTISSKIDNLIEDIEIEKNILQRYNTFDTIQLPNDIFLNSLQLKFKNGNKIELTNCYFIHDNSQIYSIFINKKEFSEFFNVDLIRSKNIIFENTLGFKDIFSEFNIKFNKDLYLLDFNGNKTEKKSLEKIFNDDNDMTLLEKYNSLTDNQKEKLIKYHIEILINSINSFESYGLNSNIEIFIKYIKENTFKNEKIAFIKLFKKAGIRI